MEIEIQSRLVQVDDGLRAFIQRRLRFALGRFQERVQRVTVRLADINGPRGGVDKRCQMLLRVAGLPDIVVADTEMDVHAAIARACDRASRTLGRYLRRARGVDGGRLELGPDGHFA